MPLVLGVYLEPQGILVPLLQSVMQLFQGGVAGASWKDHEPQDIIFTGTAASLPIIPGSINKYFHECISGGVPFSSLPIVLTYQSYTITQAHLDAFANHARDMPRSEPGFASEIARGETNPR